MQGHIVDGMVGEDKDGETEKEENGTWKGRMACHVVIVVTSVIIGH